MNVVSRKLEYLPRCCVMAVLALATIATAAHANAQTGSEAVFVMTNAADKNEVISYQEGRDGSFRKAGRFATGGRGSGGQVDPLQSQGALTFNHDHTLLFAANAGSGTVSVFRVAGPSLALVDQADSGGSEPLAIAATANVVYVLNGGAAGSVVAFRLNPSGQLHEIQNSTHFLSSTNAGGSSISVSPDGHFLAVTERLTNSIDIFPILADGTLGSIVTNASSAPGVFAAAFAPDGSLFDSETGPAGAANGSTISSYAIASNGKISAVSQGVPTFGSANCWDAITPNGQFV
jgi:6-phosphogluconolactonase